MGRKRRLLCAWLAAIALVMASAGISRAQTLTAAASDAPILVVKGEVKQELRLSAADFKALPRTKVTAKGHGGVSHAYEGVMLQLLLVKAGVPMSGEMRGKNMTLMVLLEASDAYHAVFSLAELDPDFAGEQVIVADTEDGKALDAQHGPVQLVVPGDKRQGRWVRMLNSITVQRIGESK
ncbi:MAG TPA: molybdopterin-dependent oxidoreductase [Candidatus Acidoferrum sp.]|nr:molybdopterin-dependent oxidoreductase [Candidatus Acidoferrum sp.]